MSISRRVNFREIAVNVLISENAETICRLNSVGTGSPPENTSVNLTEILSLDRRQDRCIPEITIARFTCKEN